MNQEFSCKLLKVTAFMMCVGMILLVIWTSLQSDMFNLPDVVLQEPWFWTTLVDFYGNIALLAFWVIYKEANWIHSLLWIISFITLGTIATAFYVFFQIVTLKPNEGIEAVLLRRK